MLSGAISAENLSEVLRSLSQRRRNGALEIVLDDEKFEINFDGGKIISVGSENLPIGDRIRQRLIAAGILSKRDNLVLAESYATAEELFDAVVVTRTVSKEDFIKAKNAVELDILHSLKHIDRGEYLFTPKVVRAGDGLSLKLSPGQLLLDFVDIDVHEARFRKVFGDFNATDVVVHPLDDGDVSLTFSESEVWDSLSASDCLQELKQKCLLCEYELRACLLSFYDRKLVSIEALKEISKQRSNGTSVEPNIQSLEAKLAESVPSRELLNQDVVKTDSNASTAVEPEISEVASHLSSAAISDEIGAAQSSLDWEENNSDATYGADVTDDAPPTIAEYRAQNALDEELDEEDEFVEESSNEDDYENWAESEEDDENSLNESALIEEQTDSVTDELDSEVLEVQSRRTLKTAIVSMNYRLLMADTVPLLCVIIMLAHLAMLAVVVPGLIQTWFQAVEEFSSLYAKSMLH